MTACPTDGGAGGDTTSATEKTFTPPALTLIPGDGKITYTFTFTPSQNPAADSYDLYWKKGDNLSADEVKTGSRIGSATSGGSITREGNNITNGTAYSFIVFAMKDGASIGSSGVQTATPDSSYIIIGSGTAFTAIPVPAQ